MRALAPGLAALATTITGLLAPAAPVTAATTCGGVVYQDLDADGERLEALTRGGARDDPEPGVEGVRVRVTDPTGATATTHTDAAGRWSLPVDRFPVRVDVAAPPGWIDGVTGPTTVPRTRFVDTADECGDGAVGLIDPAAYCAAAAPIVVACPTRTDVPDASPDEPAVRLVAASTRDTGRSDATQEWLDRPTESLATTGAVGTVHGLAATRDGRVLAGAFVKRHTTLVSDLNPTGNPTAVFELAADRPPRLLTILDPTATDPHRVDGRPSAHDAAAFDDVFRAGIGDLELSADGRRLYAVDLGRRALVTVDPAAGTVLGSTPLDGIRLGVEGCGVTAIDPFGDLRPFGLGLDADGDLLVGVVCAAGPPVGYVFELVGDRFHARLTWPLGGRRGDTAEGGGPARDAAWRPWVDAFPFDADVPVVSYPQPAITDLLVDAGGHLVIAIGDRWSHQTAPSSKVPSASGLRAIEEPVAAGDLQRACVDGDGWVIEGTAECPGGIGDGWEFFDGDRYGWHAETALGALAGAPGRHDVIATHIDPVPVDGAWHSGGLAWHASTTGARLDGLRLYDGRAARPDGTFEHASGLGDVELLCGELPVVLGGRFWYDADTDGVADPTEPPIAGVPLELLDPNGRTLARARTTGDGRYQFDARDITTGLDRGKRYTIAVTEDAFRAGPLGPGGAWTGLRPRERHASGRLEISVVAGDDPATGAFEPPVRQDLDVALVDQYDLALHASLAARDAELDVLRLDAVVTNQGSVPSGAFAVEARVPPGAVLVSAGDAQRPATVEGDRVTWHVPAADGLDPGASTRLPIRVRVSGRGTTALAYALQIAAADGDDDDSVPGDALLDHPASLAPIAPGPPPIDHFGATAREDDSGVLTVRLTTLAGSIWFDADRDGRRSLDPGAVEALAERVEVRLLRDDGTEFARTATDADGWFEFPLLETGTYRLEVPATNFAGALRGYDVIVRPDGSLAAAENGYVSSAIELVAGGSSVTHLGVARRPPSPFLGGATPLLIGPGLVFGTWRLLDRQRRRTRYGSP